MKIKSLLLTAISTIFQGCSSLPVKDAKLESKSYKNERVEILENGLKIYFIQDDSLPVIDIQLLIPVGSIQQPRGYEGIGSLTARLLDKGTQNKNALDISDALSDSGTDFSASAGHDFTLISTQALVTEFDKVINLTSEILFQAQFPNEEIERERKLMAVQLKSRQDRSGTFADSILTQSFFKGHAYAHDLLGTEKSLAKITQKDIREFYKNYYQPSGAFLAISGKLNQEIEQRIKFIFGQWKNTITNVRNRVAFAPVIPKEKEMRIQSPHKAQTEIRFIQNGISRSSSDFLALRIVNEILGGSFASRLNQRIRDDLGLTYSIYSYLDVRDLGGSWVISTFSKNETSAQTVSEIKTVLKRFVDEGVQKEEMNAAKNLIKAQLPRALETSDKLGYNLIALDFYGVGQNYLLTFNEKVDALTIQEINRTLRQYLKPEEMQVFIF